MPTPKGTIPWNAGTGVGWVDKRGYRWLYVTENGRKRARREHRVIMEKHIGRRLEPWEVVHHRDENPSNNDLSNLEIMEFGDHSAEHAAGSRKSYDARRKMEAFALLREELKSERTQNAQMLEALKDVDGRISALLSGNYSGSWDKAVISIREDVRAAITAATEPAQ
jgi:hypothetical protein